ncbi:MAG: biotin/lipoyl-containing protein [Verrucomicrobiota bacterium]|nr:biotin/lipoyl-containing protein [Verrucomicrobiota bacterium]
MKKLKITIEGVSYDVEIQMPQNEGAPAPVRRVAPVAQAAAVAPVAAAAAPATSGTSKSAGANDLPCPLSGVVVSVAATVGQAVNEGDTVMTLEAMKMYTAVTAHKSGTVKAVLVVAGESVDEGQGLITIE